MPAELPTNHDPREWHNARSNLLDAFADAEAAIVALLKRSGAKPNGEMLGQKIELLRAAKPSPHYSKTQRAKVGPLLDKLEQMLEIRNDIVHGKLQIAEIAGQYSAIFVNTRDARELAPRVRMIGLSAMTRLHHETARLARDLVEPPTPPSSPPPPSPAAASGP